MMSRIIVLLVAVLCGMTIAATAPAAESKAAAPAPAAEEKTKPAPQRYLHVATTPVADIYVSRSKVDFSASPDYSSPSFVKVPQGDTTVRVTLFQVGYNDTTIKVSLSDRDTSYLIVSLRQSYDEELAETQKKTLAHRNRKSLGHKLVWASFVPFAASAVAAVATQKYIQDARDDRKAVQNSLIREGERYQKKKDDFKDHRSKAKTAKAIGGTCLGTGLVVLSAGLILSF